MANNTRAYTTVKTIEDFKSNLLEYPEYVDKNFMPKDLIQMSLQGLNEMDRETSTRFLTCLHHIDKKFSEAGAANANRFHKVPTILASAIYFAYCKDSIEGLSDDEIALLSEYSIPEPFNFYETAKTTWPKELLGAINSVSDDYMELQDYMLLADHQINEGTSKQEVITYFTETPHEIIKNTAFAYVAEQFEKGAIYLWK